MEPIGTALAVAGLVTAFSGAVDGYLLLERFFSRDDGLRDLALRYHIEGIILSNWGDRYNIRAQNKHDNLLHEISLEVKHTMTRILERIQILHSDADKILETHGGDGLNETDTPSPDRSNFENALRLEPFGSRDSRTVLRTSMKKRFKWTVKNRDKFEHIVDQLRQYNEALVRLLDRTAFEVFEKTLPARMLAAIHLSNDLLDIKNFEALKNGMVSHAAELKALQMSTSHGSPPAYILRNDIALMGPEDETNPIISSMGTRQIGIMAITQRVWVEWRVAPHRPTIWISAAVSTS
jgi:hypothetical protein